MDCEVRDSLKFLYTYVYRTYSKLDSYHDEYLHMMAPGKDWYPDIQVAWEENTRNGCTFYIYTINDRAILKIFDQIGYLVIGDAVISDVQLCNHIIREMEDGDLNKAFIKYAVTNPDVVYATMLNWEDYRHHVCKEKFKNYTSPEYMKRVNLLNALLRLIFPGDFNRCLYMNTEANMPIDRHDLQLFMRAVALGGVEYTYFFSYGCDIETLLFPREFSDAEKRLIHIIRYGGEGVSSAFTTKKIYKALENGDMETAKMLAVLGYK